jgi:ABC-2 type transport system permease protein
MTGLIRAEALRLRTIRTYWLLATGAIALIAGVVALTATATSFKHDTSPARSALAIAGLAQTVALIAGVLSVTGEFRHKTITPAVLITPRRARCWAPSSSPWPPPGWPSAWPQPG